MSQTKSVVPSAKRLTVVAILLSVIAPFSVDTYLPSMPDIARDFSVSDFYLQQTLSLYMIAFAGMTLVYGPLSDVFGRRKLVLLSMAVYIASAIGCALAPNAHALVVWRVVQGVAAGGGVVIGRAIIRDSFSGATAQKVMSRIMLIFALAPAVAPIVGGWLHDVFGWRSVFWFLTLLGVLVWICAAFMLPETLTSSERQSGHPRAIAGAYWHALKQGRFIVVIAAIAFIFGGLFLYVAGSPVILYRDLGLGAQDFGYLFVPLVAGLMSGAAISGNMAGKYSHARAVYVGFAIMLAASCVNGLLTLLPPSPLTVIGPVALYACGMSLATPNLSLLAFEHLPRNRGLAAALQSFLQTAFAGVVAGLFVPALSAHVAWFAVGMFGLSLAGFACWVISRRYSP